MYTIDLNNGWMLRHEELCWGITMSQAVLDRMDGWITADLPCDVHMPLIREGIIKEPLEGDNFLSCEWIENRSWWFKKVFCIDDEVLNSDTIELSLDSLDAEADIFLNGFHLGHHKSAFYPFIQNVKKYVKTGENMLLIRLSSGLEYISELDIAEIKDFVCTEGVWGRGDKRRSYVRKPQFVYGWDWGPRVATCCIMNARIEAHNKLAIRSVHACTEEIGEGARLSFTIEVENLHYYSTLESKLKLQVLYGDFEVLTVDREVLLRSGLNYIEFEATIKDAKLWWPNGMGDQPLYTVKVFAAADNVLSVYPEFKFGIRSLQLIQEKINCNERSFAFEINGVRTYCKGGNWIPADSIYARVSGEKYDTLLMEAKEANFNMLRVWGGGIYERDIFYEKCDEYGIMLWQDFMFACALYPDNLEWFRREAEKEMDYQTRRLRNHASLVLWCGNNENHWAMDQWWIYDKVPVSFGGAYCYNEIAPRVIRNNCPKTPYWNSSPYGGEKPNGSDMGDQHYWFDGMMNHDINKRVMPEQYDQVTAKFVSEYGYIGPCRKSSIEKYHGGLPLDKSGRIWQIHNNTFEKETVPAGITKHYADAEGLDMDSYLLYAGLCQGLMYGYSLEAMRFKKDCSGSLFWMYNDCWGEVGWTVIDYYLKRKISYYFVKRAFAPVKLIMREVDGKIKVMGSNDTGKAVKLAVVYGYTSFDGSDLDTQEAVFQIKPFSRDIVVEFSRGEHDIHKGVYFVRPDFGTMDVNAAVLRLVDFRRMDILKPNLTITDVKASESNIELTVTTDTYAHGVHFNLDDGIRLSDEYFDLLPGESRRIMIYDTPEGFIYSDIRAQAVI